MEIDCVGEKQPQEAYRQLVLKTMSDTMDFVRKHFSHLANIHLAEGVMSPSESVALWVNKAPGLATDHIFQTTYPTVFMIEKIKRAQKVTVIPEEAAYMHIDPVTGEVTASTRPQEPIDDDMPPLEPVPPARSDTSPPEPVSGSVDK